MVREEIVELSPQWLRDIAFVLYHAERLPFINIYPRLKAFGLEEVGLIYSIAIITLERTRPLQEGRARGHAQRL